MNRIVWVDYAKTIAIYAGYFIFGISPAEMTAGAARGLLFAFAGLLLCIPIVLFVEKYLRVLTDK